MWESVARHCSDLDSVQNRCAQRRKRSLLLLLLLLLLLPLLLSLCSVGFAACHEQNSAQAQLAIVHSLNVHFC